MNIYFRGHSRRTRSTSNPPPPPREVVRRTRYDRNESLQEGSYSRRRGPLPRRLPFAIARGLEYDEQEYDMYQASRAEAPAVATGRCTPEPYKPPLTEEQRALGLRYADDEENDYEEKLEPNTNEAVAETTAGDKSQQEN